MTMYYEYTGEYRVPEVIQKSLDEGKIGKLGLLRLRFLQANEPMYYSNLLMKGELERHLMEIEAKARVETELLVQKLLKTNPSPSNRASEETLRQHMHSLRVMAEEAVKKELIFKQ